MFNKENILIKKTCKRNLDFSFCLADVWNSLEIIIIHFVFNEFKN